MPNEYNSELSPSKDIVERLRKHPYKSGNASEAADEIERLQQRDGFIAKLDKQIVERDDEIERLRKMLTAIYNKVPLYLLRDRVGEDKPPMDAVDAVDAMLTEIVTLRHYLRKIANGDQCTASLSHPPICSRAYQARKALGEKE